ncbi:MAG: hypothetical protein GYB31_15470 [Bacteroidetes bacterium]|nr:hypothetical protein [Bacteroidota bacterium]
MIGLLQIKAVFQLKNWQLQGFTASLMNLTGIDL